MKRIMQLFMYFSIIALFLAGCEGCFDGEITRKVDNPYVTVTPDTNYEITFSSATKGATFRYTIDGSDPTTSDSAVEGEKLTIDFLTKVKVYAYKDGMKDSAVVHYRIPTTNSMREVNYKSNHFVQDHWYKADDVFEREKIAIAYSGKGADDQWFSGDDVVSEYTLFYYEGKNLSTSKHFVGPGSDGEWFTEDDTFDLQSEFTLDSLGRKDTESISDEDGNAVDTKKYTWSGDGENLASVRANNGSGAGSEYTYDGNILLTEKVYDNSGSLTETITYNDTSTTNGIIETATTTGGRFLDFTNAYELNKRYKLVAQYDGDKLTQKVKYLGYGEDTDVGLVTYKYEGDKISEEHCYGDKHGEFEVKYTYFTYEGDNISEEEIHERFWSHELYDWDWYVTIKKYEYNSDDTLKKVEYYNDEKFKSKYENYSYEGTNAYVETFERPELPKKSITVDLTISAEGSINGGTYSMEGQNFDMEGNLTGADLGLPSDQKEFFKEAKKRIEEVIDNTDVDAQGLTITGKVAGKVRVEADAYTNSENKSFIKVWFYFEEYDDGEMMIDGELLSEFEGKFDISGKISGRAEGYIQGDVLVQDGDPEWTDEDYNQINYTWITLNGEMDPVKEMIYNAPGADADWKTVEDDQVEKVVTYEVSGNVTTKTVFTKPGNDKTWGTADDILYERFVTEVSGEKIVKEEYFSIYGTYMRDFQGSTVNDPLNKAQLKYHTWCHWDYGYGWSWENL